MSAAAEEKDDGLVLVTGATGFLALHIIQLLQREGYRVRGTVRSLKNESRLRPLRDLCPEAKYPLELVEADLTKDDGWDEVVRGCSYCMHVASPFPSKPPRTLEDLTVPAVEGTKRVLQACAKSGTVKRVVLTSSTVSVHGECKNQEGRIYTEDDWTDVNSEHTDAYAKSKTLAERAAWDFVKSLPPGQNLELATINPSAIIGPCISGEVSTSLGIIQRFFNFYSMPLIPGVYLNLCDVRDVALAHLRAMTMPEAVGKRHVIVSGEMYYPDIGKVLKEEFSPYGYCIPTCPAPNFVVHLLSFVDSTVKLVVPRLGQSFTFSDRRMKEVLKIEPRDMKESVLDTAYGLIDCGAINKTRSYKSKNK